LKLFFRSNAELYLEDKMVAVPILLLTTDTAEVIGGARSLAMNVAPRKGGTAARP
jgi:hypothetical protein